MSRYFLGVDGGQSGTTALIGDEGGQVAGIGRAGPCHQPGAIRDALDAACDQAGLRSGIRFAAACLGLSGGLADKPSVIGEIVASDRIILTTDALVALTGAMAGEPGVVVVAGTGSIAFGRNRAGRVARAGGWGYLFGDEGGGFWIVRQAMRAALRLEEGWGVPTSLRARLLDATGARNINHLMHRCYTPEFRRERAAALSILVHHAAESGDPAALKILDDAARELALLAISVRGQLFESEEPISVSYSGGVFRSRIVLSQFRQWLAPEYGVRVASPVYSPAVGALLEAYRASGFAFETIRRGKMSI